MKIEIPMLGRGKLSLTFDDSIDSDCWDVHMATKEAAKVYVGRVTKADVKRVAKAS